MATRNLRFQLERTAKQRFLIAKLHHEEWQPTGVSNQTLESSILHCIPRITNKSNTKQLLVDHIRR